ncbi:ATP-binding cassette domain-containing protein [Halonatronum saccharophilum]|uniref:ABC transporter ATP-binding protein n=1 Tax=Halonatronum saccharophilum TaxID=150060 RepID=UPI00048957AE|nr:ATP-binding cassette domain-containing protein [Halonatronum saccharophilum]
MGLLEIREGRKVYPGKVLFEDLNIQIQNKDRIGLIGENGAGKSTLVKVLIDKEWLDDGEILQANGLEIGYLEQEFGFESTASLYEEMLSVFEDLFALENRLRDLELKMSSVEGEELEKVMKRYSLLREDFEKSGGYGIDSRIKGVLRGLGFCDEDFSSQFDNFSGGQKTRAALAKLLLKEPNLLLLDEPTNHLDLEAKEWLEDYLNSYNGAVLIISHDRYFLDEVVNRVWELEKGRLEKYKGNYSFYLKEKPHRILTWQREYEKQQEYIAQTEAFVRKYKAGVKCKQARGRQKQLDRLERIPPPPKTSLPKIEFKCETRSGDEVLKVEGLTKSFEDGILFEGVGFRLYRGEKVALVGPNGSGKSTLFKILLDKLEKDSGSIKFGTKVKLGYFDQEHESLNFEYNLIEEVQKADYHMTKSEARDLLARFLFTGEDVFNPVGDLSGGEKGRLSLAKLSVQDFNLILLDEPTNHLDIRSKEILERALEEYPGTLLIISHDRYFLNSLVNKVLVIENNSIVEYDGNYSSYRRKYEAKEERKRALEREAKLEKKRKASIKDKNKDGVDLENLELKIMELEERVEELEARFDGQDIYDDPQTLDKLTKEYQDLKEELSKHYNIWEKAI